VPITLPRHLAGDTPATADTLAPAVDAGPNIAEVAPGSVAARVLFELWSGKRAVVVSSPPGAGKTSLISAVGANLFEYAQIGVGVACNTVAQVISVANRIAADSPGVAVRVVDSSKGRIRRASLAPGVEYTNTMSGQRSPAITISTTKKWGAVEGSAHRVDVLLIDEAWQCTWMDMVSLGNVAEQFCLVGDPGQIPPIITSDTSRYRTMRVNPAAPAPEALIAQRPADVSLFRFESTKRLRPLTAGVIAPLYPFRFHSDAPGATALSADGDVLPEIRRVDVEEPRSPLDERAIAAMADAVVELAGQVTVSDRRGDRPADVLAMVAHRNQRTAIMSAISGRLTIEQRARVIVDTFDSVQGLEAGCAVVLDPMFGQWDLNDHSMEPGRLCVALSRHTAHLTFVTSPSVDAAVSDLNDRGGTLNRQVRCRLAQAAEGCALAEL
jgi:hypothetical protein